MENFYKSLLLRIVGLILIGIFIWISVKHFHFNKLLKDFTTLIIQPKLLVNMTIFYGLAFVLRAYAWYLYLNKRVSYSYCLTALWYSLLINHILPIKAGDAIRIGYITAKSPKLKLDEALHSVIVMRLLDIATLLVFASIGVLYLLDEKLQIHNSLFFILGIASILVFVLYIVIKKLYPQQYRKHTKMLLIAIKGKRGFIILFSIIISWVFEASVIYGVSQSLQTPILLIQSVWINSFTVIGQVFSLAPGGIATYETMMIFAITQLELPLQGAYSIAIVSHTFKFIFSYIIGIYALITSPIKLRQIIKWIKLKGVKAR